LLYYLDHRTTPYINIYYDCPQDKYNNNPLNIYYFIKIYPHHSTIS
jgi:hypothetical protein